MPRLLRRRSFLSSVVGGSIVGAGALARIGEAQAQVTDRDAGPNADPAGRGRGRGFGITDRDSGPNADPVGRGRGPAGRGRGSVSDADSGPNADPAGRGRGRAPGQSVTDSDSGPNADPAGRGRGGAGRPRGSSSCPLHFYVGSWFDFEQSNNIRGRMRFEQPNPRTVGGLATFYSPTLRREIRGQIVGFISGNYVRLQILWDDRDYQEVSIYEAYVGANRRLAGATWPSNRPQARTSWLVRGTPLTCWNG